MDRRILICISNKKRVQDTADKNYRKAYLKMKKELSVNNTFTYRRSDREAIPSISTSISFIVLAAVLMIITFLEDISCRKNLVN
jgi:hypothetical protein